MVSLCQDKQKDLSFYHSFIILFIFFIGFILLKSFGQIIVEVALPL